MIRVGMHHKETYLLMQSVLFHSFILPRKNVFSTDWKKITYVFYQNSVYGTRSSIGHNAMSKGCLLS